MIELVNEKDCTGGKGKRKIDCSHKKVGYRETMSKRISNRDRERCHQCGHDGGSWYEHFVKGKREYHFLCQHCIDSIENR
jgi:hypothetical protein